MNLRCMNPHSSRRLGAILLPRYSVNMPSKTVVRNAPWFAANLSKGSGCKPPMASSAVCARTRTHTHARTYVTLHAHTAQEMCVRTHRGRADSITIHSNKHNHRNHDTRTGLVLFIGPLHILGLLQRARVRFRLGGRWHGTACGGVG